MPYQGWHVRCTNPALPTMQTLYTLLLAFQISSTPQTAVPSGPTESAAAAQLAQAEARYRTAIAAAPSIAAYHASLAIILERQGRLDEALLAHREAVRLDPMSERSRAALGELLLRTGRASEAIPHLQAAARLDSTAIETRKQLAAALLQQSRAREAITVLREARQLDTTDADVQRALTLAESGPAAAAPDDDPRQSRVHLASQRVRQALQGIFAIVLGVAGLVLLAPLLSGLALLLVQVPRHLVKQAVP